MIKSNAFKGELAKSKAFMKLGLERRAQTTSPKRVCSNSKAITKDDKENKNPLM